MFRRLAPFFLFQRSFLVAAAMIIGLIGSLLLGIGCASGNHDKTTQTPGFSERGLASWYGNPYHGRQTASGEIYDMHKMTAAHRRLDFGTVVRVTRRDTGDHVDVRINDRGPFVRGRIIDLSLAAAKKIGLDSDGVAPVEITILGTAGEPEAAIPIAANPDCFWVQVGAFGNRDNAERAREILRNMGERTVIMEGPAASLRVRVGPFAEAREAAAARERLAKEWPPAIVVTCGG